MLKINAYTEYFAKKKALLAALRHFSEYPYDKQVRIECLAENPGFVNFVVIFYRDKLIKQLGYDFTKDYIRMLKESEPGKNGEKEGKLYHKDNIFKIYENSIYIAK